MANTTNFGWETPDDTDLVKDGALAMRTLGNAIDTSLLDLKGGTTGQNLRKATNTDLDFTWAGDATNTVIDAEGDLLVGDSADTLQRLAIGTNNQVLTVDTTVDGKIKWATVQAGAFTSLGSTSLSSTSTVVSNISQSYKHLFILLKDVSLDTNDKIFIQPNSATTNLRNVSYSNANATQLSALGAWNIAQDRTITANQSEGTSAIWIYNYKDTASFKTANWTSCFYDNAGGAYAVYFGHGIYSVTTAITSLNIANNGNGNFNGGTVEIFGVN